MELILKLPDKVKRDVAAYRSQVERFLRGEVSPVVFRAYRVPMGIYEQRQSGTYMVRIRIAAGIASTPQVRRIAELSREYGNGIVHVTTRQDMQIHDVKIEHTPDVLERLLEVNLTSRGGGGNTVRNIAACPRAGICPREQFNVAPHALALAEYLLQFDSSYNLPRKYKIAFSGCPEDCALASVADLGFFAHRRNGTKGFAVYGGGGLGPNPAVAVKIEDFIEEREVFEVAEAVKQLFDAYGDRSNKHRARLRYVLARFGQEEFVRLYRKTRERVKRRGMDGTVPDIAGIGNERTKVNTAGPVPPDLLPEKNKGFYTAKLRLPLGDVPADDLVRIANIAETCGTGVVRTTQQQDLLVPSVPKSKLRVLRRELRSLRIHVSAGESPKVVVCAGASTCRLGLCRSRNLAIAIEDAMTDQPISNAATTIVHISGCPNCCGHHFTSEIAFQGHAKRVNGRLMPCYNILSGGSLGEGNAHLAETIGTLPARQIPQFLAQAFQTGPLTQDRLRELARKRAERVTGDIPEDYYYDWGSDTPFSLEGRGPGECGAGVMDIISVDIDAARLALKQASQTTGDKGRDESAYGALLASARALLILFGAEPKTDGEVFDAFDQYLVEPGWIEPATRKLVDSAMEWQAGSGQMAAGVLSDVERLIDRVEELFLSLDANLKFRVGPAAAARQNPRSESTVRRIDLRGVPCPLNFVQAKLAVEGVAVGQLLEIELDEGEPIRNVPPSLAQQGQEVLKTTKVGDHFCLTVRRR